MAARQAGQRTQRPASDVYLGAARPDTDSKVAPLEARAFTLTYTSLPLTISLFHSEPHTLCAFIPSAQSPPTFPPPTSRVAAPTPLSCARVETSLVSQPVRA